VDPQFQNLLNAGNISAEGGNLVLEVVCKFPLTRPDAKTACQDFTNQVNSPAAGPHVRIIGTLVRDTFHSQWIEISGHQHHCNSVKRTSDLGFFNLLLRSRFFMLPFHFIP